MVGLALPWMRGTMEEDEEPTSVPSKKASLKRKAEEEEDEAEEEALAVEDDFVWQESDAESIEGPEDEDDVLEEEEEEEEEEEQSENDSADEKDDDQTVHLKGESDTLREKVKEKKLKAQQEAASAAYFDTSMEAEEEGTKPVSHFSQMSISRPLLRALDDLGFSAPTKIQAATIPVALMGKDICGGAVTGSGKTGAFLIPTMERLLYRPNKKKAQIRVLVLTPTRELAAQCHQVAQKMAKYTDIGTALAAGGLSIKEQEAALRQRPDIVIATPGRLIDHLRNSQNFTLDSIEILVLDEADRMLEEGFKDELEEIIKYCPKSRQTLLFSATMTDDVDVLTRLALNKPVKLFVDQNTTMASKLTQEFVRIRSNKEEDRHAMLLALCRRTFTKKVIVFFKHKKTAHEMCALFNLLKMTAAELHGDLSQQQRLEALERFRSGKAHFLLCTDLLSRGIDIIGVETVINHSMPNQYPQYVHRVGRTARASRGGRAISLIGEQDRRVMKLVLKHADASGVKQRIISADIVQKYRTLYSDMQDRVAEALKEEEENKEIERAEQQIARANNLVEHEAEIMSRPKRTWFQTEKEKTKTKNEASKQHHEKGQEKPIKRQSTDGLSRRKRRRIEMLKEDPELAQKMGAQKAAAHAAKKSTRPTKLKKVLQPGEFKKEEAGSTSHKQQQKDQKRKSKKAKEKHGFFGSDAANKSSGSSSSGPKSKMGALKGKKTFAKVQNKQKNKRMKK